VSPISCHCGHETISLFAEQYAVTYKKTSIFAEMLHYHQKAGMRKALLKAVRTERLNNIYPNAYLISKYRNNFNQYAESFIFPAAIHSFHSLSYDRSIASSKVSSMQSAI
jgi:hypothetical protein